MTSFVFPKTFLCFRVRFKVRVSGNTFKNVFGQTSIRASVLDPLVIHKTRLIIMLAVLR